MKITTPDLSQERRVLTAAIVDSSFLAKTRTMFDASLMESDYAKHVAKWVIAYFDQTGKAPGRDIQAIYDIQRNNLSSDDLATLVSQFLASLSSEFEAEGKTNTEYSVQVAKEYFGMRGLVRLKDRIEAAIGKKDVQAGQQFVAEYHRPDVPDVGGVSLLYDHVAVEQCFEESASDVLFRLPGKLDDLIGPISREDFLAIGAPYKTGKSFWLDFIGKQAMLQGCKVAYYSLEMGKKQTVRRSWRGMEARGLHTKKEVRIPRLVDGQITYEVQEIEGMLGEYIDVRSRQKTLRMLSRGGDVRYFSMPRGTFSPKDLRAHLNNLEYYENYIPDVVLVDGADNMRCDNPRLEKRHQLDDIWGDLSAIRIERHIAIGTVSHMEAGTKKTGKGDNGSYSEAKSKSNHVTLSMNLGQTDEMREAGYMLVTSGATRDGETNTRPLCVLECRDIGRVVLDTEWAENVYTANGQPVWQKET